MKPITRAEVEAAMRRPCSVMLSEEAREAFRKISPNVAYGALIGYEIAKARHQSAETKWENTKAHFERHVGGMGASWALDIMKQEDEAEEWKRARAEKGGVVKKMNLRSGAVLVMLRYQ